jgi:DNA-binding transcriptional LysR family regulator
MEIRHLRAFLAIARHRSFTRAARELFITQPAISQQIRVLEADLGTALFRRDGHAIELTDAGIALVPDAEAILRAIDEARSRLASRTDVEGTLRVVTGTIASTMLYGGIYSRFVRAYPRIAFRLTVGVGIDAVPEMVQAGQADVGFVGFPIAADSELESEILGTTELVAVARPGERMKRVMCWDTSPGLRRVLDDARLPIDTISNSVWLLKRFVRERAGTAILPHWAVLEELESGELEIVPLDLPPLREPMGLVYARSRRSRELAAFLTVVHEYKPILREICSGRAFPDETGDVSEELAGAGVDGDGDERGTRVRKALGERDRQLVPRRGPSRR